MGNESPSDPDSPFAGEPTDTQERIMQATFRTIQRYGYAGLSIQRIADEADLSKSSFYHFFDDKDDLLLSFLDYMLGHFGLPLEGDYETDPLDGLWTHIDFALYGVGEESTLVEGERFDPGTGRPYVEIRAQAIHDEAYRERFTVIDASLRDRLASIVASGVERGVFREVDPERTAEFLLTVMMGGLFRRATGDVDVDAVREELEAVVRCRLLADESGSDGAVEG